MNSSTFYVFKAGTPFSYADVILLSVACNIICCICQIFRKLKGNYATGHIRNRGVFCSLCSFVMKNWRDCIVAAHCITSDIVFCFLASLGICFESYLCHKINDLLQQYNFGFYCLCFKTLSYHALKSSQLFSSSSVVLSWLNFTPQNVSN